MTDSRVATNANTVETILHGSVGLLTARSGGHLVSLQCYVSPYDIFEEGTSTQLNLTDNNGRFLMEVSKLISFNHKISFKYAYYPPLASLQFHALWASVSL